MTLATRAYDVLVTRFDFRAPGAGPEMRRDRYRAALDLARYAEETGHDAVNLSEHHGAEDGYLPSPLIAASAIAAVTSRIPISVWAVIAPLYDPVRLAEDMSVLDHLSAGRVSYTFGLGYGRPSTTLPGGGAAAPASRPNSRRCSPPGVVSPSARTRWTAHRDCRPPRSRSRGRIR